MLKIILLILRILGIVFLSVLGLLLLLLTMVLFIPIRYKIKAKKLEETWAKARIKWLFGIILIKLDYMEDKLTYSVRVCGKLIVSDKPKKSKRKKNKPDKKKRVQEELAEFDDSEEMMLTDEDNIDERKTDHETAKVKTVTQKAEDTDSYDTLPMEEDEIKQPETDKAEDTSSEKTKNSEEKEATSSFWDKITFIPRKIKTFISNVINKIRLFVSKIKDILNKIGKVKAFIKDPDNKPAFIKLLSYVKHILKHIKPTKLKLSLRFGTGDPCSTGQILGAICAICPPVINAVQLHPDFEEKVLEGDLYARGRIRVFTLLRIAIKVIIDKDIKRARKNMSKLKTNY